MWRLLSRCIAMSAATAYVAQRIGREQEAKIRAAGLEPAISQSLDVLDEMIGKMDAAFEDAIRRAQQR